MMETNIPWEKIQYYLKNSEESFDNEFESWINEKKANRTFWEETRLMYSLTNDLPGDFDPDKQKAWLKIEKRTSEKTGKWKINQFFSRVAASILLIALGASAAWFLSTKMSVPGYAEVYSPFGHKTLVVLPDSSKVWLNGDTRLRYEANFAHSRKVELTGEAFFEVKKDHGKLFSVRSSDMKVEVYGTKFNVKHYPDEVNTEVALIEGSIGLFNNKLFLTKMAPGEVVDFNRKTNSISISRKDMVPIISWTTDELVLENKEFKDVLNYLERWYGVEITTDKNMAIDQQLSFKVKSESLQELLSVIDKITPIQYTIDGKKVFISKKE